MMQKYIVLTLIAYCFSISVAMGIPKGKITVASKGFTEQFLLAQITVQVLEQAGYEVEEKLGMPTLTLRDHLLNREIDIYWEYTGTGYAFLTKTHPDIIYDQETLYQIVKKHDLENNIVWLNKAKFSNSYVLVVTKRVADQLKLQTLSDLAKVLNSGVLSRFGLIVTFYDRPDGYKQLKQRYRFEVPREQIDLILHDEVYELLKRDQIQVGLGYATDPQLNLPEFVALQDDLSFFQPYEPAPTVHKTKLEQYPEISHLLNRIADRLDTSTMITLNYRVDFEGKSIDEVALTWLREVGLIESR